MDAVLTTAGIVVGVVAAALAALTVCGIVLLVRRNRRSQPRAVSGRPSPGGELLRADEALRDASDELDYAVAQFGEDGTAPFKEAIERARGELRRAFELQQRIADHPTGDPRRLREWGRDVAAIARRVSSELEGESRRFAERRGEEAGAGETVAALREQLAALRAARTQAQTELDALRGEYAADLAAPVAGNPAEADILLDTAAGRLDAAAAELAARRVTDVGEGLREARDTLGQAAGLLAGVGRRRSELAAADEALAALIAEAQAQLADARSLRDDPPDADSGKKVGDAIEKLTGVLDRVDNRPADGLRDPVAALDALVAATEALDVATAAARNQQRRLDGARAALTGALVSARTQIAGVRDYIGSRRGRVGVDARTRLAEAERQLLLAENEADPVAALDAARRAQTHARDADALARY